MRNSFKPELVLWPGVLGALDFDAQLAIAQQGRFTSIAVSPLTAATLAAQGVSHEALRARVSDHGLTISHLDGMSSWAPVWTLSPTHPAYARYGERFNFPAEQCLDIAQTLQARSIVAVAMYEAGSLATGRVAESFARFCEQAGRRGLRVELEFIPYSGVPHLSAAWDILKAAAVKDAGLIVDTWHFCKASTAYAHDIELLRTLPASLFQTAQLADAAVWQKVPDPFAELVAQGRGLPGDGALPIVDMLARLMQRGMLTSVGPEPSSRELLDLPINEIARRASVSTRDTVDAARDVANQPAATAS